MEHTVKSYRDLIAWQRARELVKEVYLLTATFPVGERFGLVSQMDRSAVSVPSNIAEDLGLCGREAASQVGGTLREVIRLLQGLAAALERRVEK